jgi:RNAse (barnase) inhibitor barstar
MHDFKEYARSHFIWREIESNIKLQEFIEKDLASTIITSSLLSGELDALPMQIVYIDEECFQGRDVGREAHSRNSFRRKIITLIHRSHESLRVVSRVLGGRRYSCLVVQHKGR